MGVYANQDLDFIIRTRKIVKQYDNFSKMNLEERDNYNVTLFFNCCVGLIIIPKQEFIGKLPTKIINAKEHGINPDKISQIRENLKGFDFVATHIRNSIAHNNFSMKSSTGNKDLIDTIHFEDYLPPPKGQKTAQKKGVQTFDAEINFEEFKKFALFLSNFYLKKMAQEKGYYDIDTYMKEFYPNDVGKH